MTTKLKPFAEIIKLTKEKIDEAKAPIRAMQMKMKGESEMLDIDSKLLDIDNKIQDICTAYPIDFTKLLDTLDEKALLERRKAQYGDVLKQLFPK